MKLPAYDNQHLLFGMIIRVANGLQVLGDRLFEEITMKQWFVLIMLRVFEEEYPTINELAEEVGSSHQNVKQLILKLEEKGYVEIFTDEKDKRKKRVKPTGKWDQIELKYMQKEAQQTKELFKGIDEELLSQAVQAILQFSKNLEGMKEE